VQDSLCDADTLLKTLGKIADQAPSCLLQTAALPGPGDRLAQFRLADTVQPGAIDQVFVDRQVGIDWRLFRRSAPGCR
jgi:hypothetical protein